jgi:hypothetical protein
MSRFFDNLEKLDLTDFPSRNHTIAIASIGLATSQIASSAILAPAHKPPLVYIEFSYRLDFC